MAGEAVPKSGETPQQGLEILDSEKLGKYGALYGRFLLASQAQPEEVASIIDPDKPVEFNLTPSALKKRNYNPISENLSFQERQEEWKTVPLFNDAYSQWRTKFTGFMTQITDPKREFILKMIIHDSKKAAEFNESDADRLFNDFCKGKSDVTAFIDRVTASLANPDGDGKINPMTIQTVLPHIEWIASGLFGKKTTSTIVTRLIELESALKNNPEQVVGIFNSDKQRVKNLTDDERKVLGSLHSLIPQTKVPAPKPTPATTSEEPKPDEKEPPAASVQFPKVDNLEAELAKWKLRLSTSTSIANIMVARARIAKLEDQIAATAEAQPPAPATVSVPEPAPVITKPEKTKREIDDELIKLLLSEEAEDSPPAPPPAESASEPKTETPHQPAIEEVAIEGSEKIRLKVNGKDLGFDFSKVKANGKYSLSLEGEQTEYLNIPEDIIVRFETRGSDDDLITIIGGKDTRLNIKDLNSLGIVFGNLQLLTPENDDWKILMREQPEHKGQAWVVNDIYNFGKSVARWMTMEELENYLKTRKEEIEKNKIAKEKAVRENIIDVEHINIDNLPEELNKLLSQNKDRSHIVFSFSPKQFKAYMVSMVKDFRIEGGDIEVVKDEAGENNRIQIRNLRIAKAGIGVTLDLVIDNFDDSIVGKITEFRQDFLAKLNKDSSIGAVASKFRIIGNYIQEGLEKQIAMDNSLWVPLKISIAEGKFLIRFEKRPQEV